MNSFIIHKQTYTIDEIVQKLQSLPADRQLRVKQAYVKKSSAAEAKWHTTIILKDITASASCDIVDIAELLESQISKTTWENL